MIPNPVARASRTGFRVTRAHVMALLDLHELATRAMADEKISAGIMGRMHHGLDPEARNYASSLANVFQNLRQFAGKLGFEITYKPEHRKTEPWIAKVKEPLALAQEVDRLLANLPEPDEDARYIHRLHSRAAHYRKKGEPNEALESEIRALGERRRSVWRAKAATFLRSLARGRTWGESLRDAGIVHSTAHRWGDKIRSGQGGPFADAMAEDPALAEAAPPELKPGGPRRKLAPGVESRESDRARLQRKLAVAFLGFLKEGFNWTAATKKTGINPTTAWEWAKLSRKGRGPFAEAVEIDPSVGPLPARIAPGAKDPPPGSRGLRRNSDELLRWLERAVEASPDDLGARVRLLRERVRSGRVLEANVKAAAYMGVPEATVLVGISGFSPQMRRDELLRFLTRSDRAYAVLWGWACASVVIQSFELYQAEHRQTISMAAREVVQRWLEEWQAEQEAVLELIRTHGTFESGPIARVCRDYAFANAGQASLSMRDGKDLLCSAAAYSALSVAPQEIDFPENVVENGEPVRSPGDFPLWLPTFSTRYVRSSDDDVMVPVEGAYLPLLSSPPTGVVPRADQVVADAANVSRWPTVHVDLSTAAAALAHLTLIESTYYARQGRGLEEVMLAIEPVIAHRIREHLLSENPREPFSRGLFDVAGGERP